MTDYNTSSDGVGLNAPGSSGSLIATDLVSVNGNTPTHVQYMKMGWGGTGDTYYPVGDETDHPHARPLPIMLRATDGTALTTTDNVLDVHISTQGVTFEMMSYGSLSVEGTAGMHPLEVEGSNGAAPMWMSATGGTTLPNNGVNTLPVMIFGLCGDTVSPLGITNDRINVFVPDMVGVKAGEDSPLYMVSTGGFTYGKTQNTYPVMMMGMSGNSAAAVGMSADMIKVYIGQTAEVFQQLTGSGGADLLGTMPSLVYGITGATAEAIRSTGGRLWVYNGDTISITADATGIPVHLSPSGTTLANNGLSTMPVMLFGLSGDTAAPITVTAGMMKVSVGDICITADVTITPNMPVVSATADAGIHNRYQRMAGISSAEVPANEITPLFVSGMHDGSTYAYPIGITTAGDGLTAGGEWHLMVTGGVDITKWSAGTMTISGTNLDVRGLTAKGGKDIVGVVGVSGSTEPVLIAIHGSGGTNAANLASEWTLPSLMFGISAGNSAAPVGISADRLKVYIPDPVSLSSSESSPLFIQATGGLSASSGTNSKVPLYNTVPALSVGLSGSVGAPVGMSADALKVYNIDEGISAERDSISVFGGLDDSFAGGTYNVPWIPSLLMGCSGASAAGVGMSGDAINVNMVNAGITLDVNVETHVEVSNDSGPALYIQGATNGASADTTVAVTPVFVAGGTYGEAVWMQGTAGGRPIEVMGYSGDNFVPVGITSDNNWKIASDESLVGAGGIGSTLDNIYSLVMQGLSQTPDGSASTTQKFSTEATLLAMSPDGTNSASRIANAANQYTAIGYLNTIQGAVEGGEMQVDIVDFPQPSSFVSGQQTATSSATVLHSSSTTLMSGVKVKGHQNNQDYIYVGISGVDATTGYPLGPSEEIFLEIDDIQKVFIYASPGGTACYIAS